MKVTFTVTAEHAEGIETAAYDVLKDFVQPKRIDVDWAENWHVEIKAIDMVAAEFSNRVALWRADVTATGPSVTRLPFRPGGTGFEVA